MGIGSTDSWELESSALIPNKRLALLTGCRRADNSINLQKWGGCVDNWRVQALLGIVPRSGGKATTENIPKTRNDRSMFSQEKYQFFLNAPFEIGSTCCRVMKKTPTASYGKKTGRVPLVAMMASESKLRTQKWLRQGCNAFDATKPMSMPMAFWTEQDVLLYIHKYNVPIAPVYGDVVKVNEVDGQLDWEDLGLFDIERPALKTTGASRTGCVFCAYGLHLEDHPNRFELLSKTHPKMFDFLMRGYGWDDRGMWMPKDGLGYWFIISWINIHGDMDIRVPNLEEYRQKYSDERTEELLRKE